MATLEVLDTDPATAQRAAVPAAFEVDAIADAANGLERIVFAVRGAEARDGFERSLGAGG